MPQADRDATRRAFSKPAAFVVLNKGLTLKTELTAARLRELMHYCPKTGIFTWRKPVTNVPAGAVAGTVSKDDGYARTSIDGRRYLLHRLAWLYVMGVWPDSQIDHRNRRRSDNRFDNLRPATNGQNGQNAACRSDNNSGFTGVSRHGKKWRAAIGVDGRRKHLGRFSSPQAASQAYAKAKAEMHTFQPVIGAHDAR